MYENDDAAAARQPTETGVLSMSQPASWDQIEPDQIEVRAGQLGDAPLAHALRRRLAELRRPGDPFATFSEHTDDPP